MMAPWRPLAFAAALNLTVVVGITTAQTVMVTKAPRGATIELALNAATIGTATAGPTGQATLPVNLPPRGGRTEADVQVFVDVCGNDLRRVTLVEPGLQPQPPQIGCSRRELAGVFLLKSVTTMVVEVTASSPAIWLRQGPVPTEWLGEESGKISSKLDHRPSPTGLILFGGGGLAMFSNVTLKQCGSVTACTGKDSRLAYTGGATVWVTQFLGAEASYVKPADVIVTGADTYFNFNTSVNVRYFTVVGKVAVPLGAVRLYGQVGGNRHQATFSTNQTLLDRPYTAADGTTGTFTGGKQTFTLQTAGWGMVYGAGVEFWVAPRFGLYAEGEYVNLRGPSRDGSEGKMSDQITSFRIGMRFRLIGR